MPIGRVATLCAAVLCALSGSAPAAFALDPAHTASENKAVVLAYLDLMINQRRVGEAMERYVAPEYVQHNPKMPGGRDATTAALEALSKGLPDLVMEVKRTVAEGDMVVVHSFGRRNASDRGVAVVDLYRLKDGLIVEHWDVIQDVPETAMNENSMF
jgi:predicted SnoaL-like aldol condensation-catalyzing enzyme